MPILFVVHRHILFKFKQHCGGKNKSKTPISRPKQCNKHAITSSFPLSGEKNIKKKVEHPRDLETLERRATSINQSLITPLLNGGKVHMIILRTDTGGSLL